VNISINSVNPPAKVDKKYIFKDLALDLRLAYTQNKQAHKLSEIKDAVADYDMSAIRNSIFNLFTTIPGQKLLNPVYGLNLVQFLFMPITPNNAQTMGEHIQSGITNYEPRVTIQQIGIQQQPDQNQYTITLSLFVPVLKQSVNLAGILNNSGFYYV
jgi:phage baseplate assembly protein W